MPLKRTLSYPNLTRLRNGDSFDIKTRTIKTPPRYLKNRTAWFPCKTQSLPNLSKIEHKLLDQDFENAVKKATRELQYRTLYLLLEIPVSITNKLITRILIILLFCSFTRKMRKENFQYKQQLASRTFTILLNKIPLKKYPLVATLISENFWRIYNDKGYTIIWPLRFLSILIKRNTNVLLEKPSILNKIYKDYKNHYSASNLIRNGRKFHIYEPDYNELKQIIFTCSECDDNFASKIAPQTDIIVFEKLMNCKDPLFFHKILIFKVIHNVSGLLTLKEQCRRHVRLLMRKRNINYTLWSLQIPKNLQKYLMFAEDNSENKGQISELTFWSAPIPRSKDFLTYIGGPIFNVQNNFDINCGTKLSTLQKF